MPDNYERLIRLAEKVFDFRNDPGQLSVNEGVIEKLQRIHPSTLLEQRDQNGPVAWVLLIPTTNDLMKQFLEQKISERQLFEFTKERDSYESIYLCSALVLEEYQRKGIVKELVLTAIRDIQKANFISALFVWPFTEAGDATAIRISELTGLPLFKRKSK
jgi:hypothetical protein